MSIVCKCKANEHFYFQDGFLSALPYLVCWASQTGSSILADFLRSRQYFSTVITRKMLNSFGKACYQYNNNLTIFNLQWLTYLFFTDLFYYCNQIVIFIVVWCCKTDHSLNRMAEYQPNVTTKLILNVYTYSIRYLYTSHVWNLY